MVSHDSFLTMAPLSVFTIALFMPMFSFLFNTCGSPNSLAGKDSTNCTIFLAGSNDFLFPPPADTPVDPSLLQLFLEDSDLDSLSLVAPLPGTEDLLPVTSIPSGNVSDVATSTFCVPFANETLYQSLDGAYSGQESFQHKLLSVDTTDGTAYNFTTCVGYIEGTMSGVDNPAPCSLMAPDYQFCCDFEFVPQDNLVASGLESLFVCDSTRPNVNNYRNITYTMKPDPSSEIQVVWASWFTSTEIPTNPNLWVELGQSANTPNLVTGIETCYQNLDVAP
jgi:hypothetical protein